jgi:hypothetical protein
MVVAEAEVRKYLNNLLKIKQARWNEVFLALEASEAQLKGHP